MNDGLRKFLQGHIDAGDFPSASYLVAQKGRVVYRDALGLAVVDPERIPATVDTIYDLASLTKPLVTGLLAAMLIESGSIGLDYRVATILSEFDVEGKRTTTVLDLLTHTSHLPAWRPFYLEVKDPNAVLAEIAGTELEFGSDNVIYSDLNYITLAAIIERFGGKKLDQLASERIFASLGLEDTCFNTPLTLRRRIAASENGSGYERDMCRTMYRGLVGLGAELRTGMIWGEVHDSNAWFMNGVAGHAGLFSTAADVFRIARQFLPAYTTLLKPETCKLFSTNYTRGMNEHRSLAFQLASTEHSTAGVRMPPDSFGHNGFTGTSLWIDPAGERIFVLLTNRTHNRDLPFANINSIRRDFHSLATDLLNDIPSNE